MKAWKETRQAQETKAGDLAQPVLLGSELEQVQCLEPLCPPVWTEGLYRRRAAGFLRGLGGQVLGEWGSLPGCRWKQSRE